MFYRMTQQHSHTSMHTCRRRKRHCRIYRRNRNRARPGRYRAEVVEQDRADRDADDTYERPDTAPRVLRNHYRGEWGGRHQLRFFGWFHDNKRGKLSQLCCDCFKSKR